MSVILEGRWVVESMNVDGAMLAPEFDFTLEVRGDQVTGKAINRIVGHLGVDKVFGDIATTRMAGPPEIMGQEQVFLLHLSTVDHVEPVILELTAGGMTVLRLRRQEPDEEE